MTKAFHFITFAFLIILLSIFASSNSQTITVNIFATDYVVETSLYVFTFLIAILFFVLGGFYASGYNILKDFKIFWLNKKVKKISKKIDKKNKNELK
jgi:uncharacterized membrane protein YciS (DUF1049 family)